MSRMLGLALAGTVIASVGAGSASANTLTLATTIRDFCVANGSNACPSGYNPNPNFEQNPIPGVQPTLGAVSATLGGGGKPVFIGTGKDSFTNADDFNEWYNDVVDVNQSKTYNLVLNSTGNPGEYQFTSNAFYPIDNQLYGNQGRSHNYHFTLELHTTAVIDENDTFSFTGDDDLWVFVNGKQIIDLGGIHAAKSASYTFTSANLTALGFDAGDKVSFDLFFAERHTTESNFKMTTSIALTEIPVPAALPIIGAALAGFGFAGWRKQRNAA